MHRLVCQLIVGLSLLCGFAIPVMAADMHDPLNYTPRQLGAVLGMTLLGGFAGWYRKVSRGEVAGHSLFALVGEMATSSLSGLGGFIVADYMGLPLAVSAAVAGMCGYMGGRAIEVGERWLARRAAKVGG